MMTKAIWTRDAHLRLLAMAAGRARKSLAVPISRGGERRYRLRGRPVIPVGQPVRDGEAIAASIAKKGITELLHFTTNAGLAQIVNSEGVKARTRLESDQYLDSSILRTPPIGARTGVLGLCQSVGNDYQHSFFSVSRPRTLLKTFFGSS